MLPVVRGERRRPPRSSATRSFSSASPFFPLRSATSAGSTSAPRSRSERVPRARLAAPPPDDPGAGETSSASRSPTWPCSSSRWPSTRSWCSRERDRPQERPPGDRLVRRGGGHRRGDDRIRRISIWLSTDPRESPTALSLLAASSACASRRRPGSCRRLDQHASAGSARSPAIPAARSVPSGFGRPMIAGPSAGSITFSDLGR